MHKHFDLYCKVKDQAEDVKRTVHNSVIKTGISESCQSCNIL